MVYAAVVVYALLCVLHVAWSGLAYLALLVMVLRTPYWRGFDYERAAFLVLVLLLSLPDERDRHYYVVTSVVY